MISVRKLSFVTVLAITLTTSPLFSMNADSSKTVKITTGETASLATIAAIDKNEILLSIIATNKKPSSDVADFAKMMIEMHGSNLTQILEMVNTLNARPLVSATAEKIQAENTKNMMALGGLQGEKFDAAYIDAMVNGHQAALNLIDQHLMKTAKSEEIKKFIADTRTVVVEHLDAAKKIQQDMKS